MNSIINIYFLFLVLFIYYIFNNKILLYNKLQNSEEDEIIENYDNILDINYIDKYKTLDNKIYKYNIKKNQDIPILLTNYRYSIEYKFGFELSKYFKIKFKESPGLHYNLENYMNSSNKNLLMVSELDYINEIKKNKKNNYRFVCSLYKVYFVVISKIYLNFNSWKDIKNYPSYLEFMKKKNPNVLTRLPKKLRIGIPSKNTNSYNDAKNLFNSIGIDINNNNNFDFIIASERELFKKLKLRVNDKNSIDLIYLTTTYKNTYLEDFLINNDCHLFGINGINDNVIKSKLGQGILFKSSFDNKKITDLITEKNIYENIQSNIKLLINDKQKNIIGSITSNTYATRIILIAHKDLNKTYVKYLLRNLYASKDKIKNNMNKYLLNDIRNNTIDDLLDPYLMFFINEKLDTSLNYHKGAYEFYEEINFISNKENLNDNIYYNLNNKNVFSKLFITNN